MAAASRQVVVRPAAASTEYAALREEMASFLGTFGDVARVNALAAALVAGGGDLARALEEEELWQQTSLRFVYGKARDYAGFEDVAHPFMGAVYALKFGLRLLARFGPPSAAKGASTGAATGEGSQHTALRLLVAFPSSTTDIRGVARGSAVAAAATLLEPAMLDQVLHGIGGDASSPAACRQVLPPPSRVLNLPTRE